MAGHRLSGPLQSASIHIPVNVVTLVVDVVLNSVPVDIDVPGIDVDRSVDVDIGVSVPPATPPASVSGPTAAPAHAEAEQAPGPGLVQGPLTSTEPLVSLDVDNLKGLQAKAFDLEGSVFFESGPGRHNNGSLTFSFFVNQQLQIAERVVSGPP